MEKPYPAMRVGAGGTLLYANRASHSLVERWGYGADVHPHGPGLPSVAEVLAEGRTKELEVEAEGRTYSLLLVPVASGGYANVYASDITARKQAEQERELLLSEVDRARRAAEQFAEELTAQKEELERQGERLAVTLRSIGDGVITTDAQGRVSLMNRAAESLTGWSENEAAGRPLPEVLRIIYERSGLTAEDPARGALVSGEVVALANNTVLVARDGRKHMIADSGAPIRDARGTIVGAVVVFQDVTERHKLQDELAKANKLESLGLLAGGIAHDFNNLLTGILGNVVLAKIEAGGSVEPQELLVEAEHASLRARDLTQRLLTFARGGAPVRKLGSLAELLVDAGQFSLRGSSCKLRLKVATDLWPVEIDAGQMAQVIQNLVINAQEAMPHGGTVTIAAENVRVRPTDALPLSPGGYVRVTVADEGVGIDKEINNRIYDPYFTAKPKGSGIGLSVCYSVVIKHDGYITAESRPGQGSCFYVYLPAAGTATSADWQEATQRPKDRILVMDDEEVVWRVAGKMLGKLGYEVEVASHGGEALELYQRASDLGRAFDAVILDLAVPGGMGGLEALARLKALNPDVKAAISSGYSDDQAMSQFSRHGFAGVVAKPYRLEELDSLLHSMLEP